MSPRPDRARPCNTPAESRRRARKPDPTALEKEAESGGHLGLPKQTALVQQKTAKIRLAGLVLAHIESNTEFRPQLNFHASAVVESKLGTAASRSRGGTGRNEIGEMQSTRSKGSY